MLAALDDTEGNWKVQIIQATAAIVETVIVESTVLVEQTPLTTQFHLLIVESPL